MSRTAPSADSGTTTTTTTTTEGWYWERAKHGAAPLVIGAVGLAALGIGQMIPLRHHVESDLRTRSLSALQAAGLSGVSVDFTGRDGTLSGTVNSPADIDKALQLVRGLDGVRVATADLHASGGTAPAPAGFPTVKAVTSGGKVTLTGTVGTEAAHQALVASATQTFGAGNVIDQLTVDGTVSDAGVAGLGAVLTALGTGSAATADLTGGALTLSGAVADAAAVTAATSAAGAAVGDPAKVTNQLTAGAPTTAPAPSPSTGAAGAAGTQKALIALPRVTFDTASATLTPQGRTVVDSAAAILKANPALKVRVEGYTDDLGDWDVNKALSTARANTVRLTLIADGVAAGRLTSFGWSEEHPKVPNTSDANRATNRRVEFVVLP